MRMITRYPNRKFYDARESRYLSVQRIGILVREGEEVVVLESGTGRDLTSATLAQVIYEDEVRQPRLSSRRLAQIIRTGQIP